MSSPREADVACLVAAAYDAALDGTLWPSVVERLRIAFGAQSVNVSGFSLARMQGFVINAGTDPAMIESYVAHYVRTDPVPSMLVRLLPSKQLFARSALLPDAELVKTEYYSDWVRPQGVWHSMFAVADCGETLNSVITLNRERHQNDFGANDAKALQALLPHFGRAVRITCRLAEVEARGAGMEGLLSQLSDGALLLAANGALLYANPAAEALVRAADGLVSNQGKLRAAHVSDNAALQRAIAAAARGSGATLAIARPSGRPSLAVAVHPRSAGRLSASDPWRIAPISTALVFVVEPDRDRDSGAVASALQALYGLTPAEAAVAETVASGQGVAEAAVTLGIAPTTLRWHLRRVFEKTGTARQAELARLVERLRPVTGSDRA